MRWYLVTSHRENGGKPRTKWLVYLGGPPDFKLKKFIARANKHPALEFFFPLAIESIKRDIIYLRKRRKEQRSQQISRLKRRRELYAAHKAGLPALRRDDPLSRLTHWFWNVEHAIKNLSADPRLGPIKDWPKDQKQKFREAILPTLELISEIESKILGKKHSETSQPSMNRSRESINEEPKSQVDMIQKMLRRLDDREQTIIRSRYGFDDGAKETLAEIGRKFGVTRERIRQIEQRALQKMRA